MLLAAGAAPSAWTEVYSPPVMPLPSAPPDARPAALLVADSDSISAALALAASVGVPRPVAVLNFANAHTPGGGYLSGASAQEEDLCRVLPALHPQLASSGRYPLSPAVVLRTLAHVCRWPGSYTRLSLAERRVPVLVLTAAAIDRRQGHGGEAGAAYLAEMRRRTRAVLCAAESAGCGGLVLGAWGCGVFENGVDDVAGFFADALASDEWRGRFEAIVFAVPGQGRGAQMRDVFSRRIAALL